MAKRARQDDDPKFIQRAMGGLLLLVLLIYGQTLSFNFTNWDDPALVVENPAIQAIGLETFVPKPGQAYQPIRVLSYAIDAAIWGIDRPWAFHLTNLILHATATLLLFLTVLRMLPLLHGSGRATDAKLALLVAALFAAHPINVEAVAWVASRKYVLLANFAFLAFYAYFRRGPKWQIAVPVATLFAILSSPFGVVIPALLSLFQYCRAGTREAKRLCPAWGVFLIMAPILWWVLVSAGAQGERVATSGEARANLWTMLRCLFDYAQMLILPIGLNNKYVDLLQLGPGSLKVLLSIAGIAALATWVIREHRKGKRLPLFCSGWFFIAWAPVSNLVPISTTMADRYLYLPAIGIFIGVALMAERKLTAIWPVIIAIFAISATVRARVWQNSETLWRDSLEKAPNSPIAHNSLGEHLQGKGELAEAIQHFRRAIEIFPNAGNAQSNLGAALRLQENFTGALHHLEIARDLAPNLPAVYLNLGGVYNDAKRPRDALKAFERLLELKPESALGWFGIGLAHEALNTPSQAIGDYQRAIQFGIRQPAAHNNLGVLLAARGDLPGAIAQYNAAIALNAQFADACYNRGVAKFANGDSAGALADYKQAISVDPNHAPAINNLGAMFRDAGNTEHALLLLQKAVDVNPEFLLARRNLAATLRLAGRTAEADALATDVSNPQYDLAMQLEKAGDRAASLKSLRDAIKSVPNDVRARNALAWRLLQQPAPTPDERRESLTHALRAAELTEQKNARVLLTLALAHAAAEDYAQARSVANSALALNPPKDVQAPIRNLLSQLPTK